MFIVFINNHFTYFLCSYRLHPDNSGFMQYVKMGESHSQQGDQIWNEDCY
jgi:hypothetical protein